MNTHRTTLGGYVRSAGTVALMILSGLGCEETGAESAGAEGMLGGALVAGESVAGESVAGESVAGESVAGESVAGESVAGESVAGESVAGESVAGESVAGESNFEPPFVDLNSDANDWGPAPVGYRTEQLTYTASLTSEGTRTPREIRLALWYPARADTGESPARYPLFSAEIAEQEAAPMIEGRAPLLVYSHGATVWPEMGSFMAEFFASHGWVVVAVEHTGDTVANASGPRPDMIYAQRPSDLSAALDYLENLSPEHPLADRIETSRALVSGHSFGGYTSFAIAGARFDMEHLRSVYCVEREGTLCESLEGTLGDLLSGGFSDSRFVAAIPQSAGNFAMIRAGAADVTLPTLMITATRDQACTEEGSNQPYWEALTAPESRLRAQHRRLSFLDAGHATFTVACIHLPGLEQDDGCGPDFTPVREAQRVMLAYSLVFGRAYVLGDVDARASIDSSDPSAFGLLPSLPAWAEWLTPAP